MATVFERVQSLGEIITDAVTAGVDTNVPPREIRNSLVKVATGTYTEVLPIRVPAETCIIGDELRSTNVQPRKATNATLTPRKDFRFSHHALNRLTEIIGDVVDGTSVTPTSGNNVTQFAQFPLGQPAERDSAEMLSKILIRNIDSSLQTQLGREIPASASTDADFQKAADMISTNKEFIQQEVIAYIKDQYPNLDYSRTSCKKDVAFISDAVVYDLVYTGNWQSIQAGLAYYDGSTGNLQIDSEEKTATIAAYTHLKDVLKQIGRSTAVSPQYSTGGAAQFLGDGGSVAASTAIDGLVDDIITIINLGPDNAPTITYPNVAGVAAGLTGASTTLLTKYTDIKEGAIDFISKNFGSFRYNATTCRRDLGRILTDVALDVALGTNYNAVFNGISYTRPVNAYNLQTQRTETSGAIRFAKGQAGAALTDATALSRSNAAFDEILDILDNSSIYTTGAVPGDGLADALSLPTGLSSADQTNAAAQLDANRVFIAADVNAYVAATYPSLTYDAAKCARDVGYILDALRYDILYGGNSASIRIAQSYFGSTGAAYPAGQITETAAAYTHMKSILDDIIEETSITPQTGNTETQNTAGTAGTSTESTTAQNNLQVTIDAITAGNTDSLPTTVFPNLATLGVSGTLQTEKAAIDTAQPTIILDTIQYINTTYSDFKYNQAKCMRDIGLILDAARYDWQLGSNFAGMVAAMSYLRRPSAKVRDEQKAASLASFKYAKEQAKLNVGGDATAIAGLETTFEWIDNVLFGGSNEGSNRQTDEFNVYAARRQLELNKEFIKEELTTKVNNFFKGTSSEIGAANIITISSTNWLHLGMEIKFDSILTGVPEIVEGQTYYVRTIVDGTHFTISETYGGAEHTLNQSTTGTMNILPVYEYNTTLCKRDIDSYIDAIKEDMTWPANYRRDYTDSISCVYPGIYKTRYAARYYVNSVIGSQEEDFYYLRNGTGIRLQTLQGLDGDLSPNNALGTKRPTAGAVCSLDPGWGPNDEDVWIISRSPYVQNCTTFGNAAVGQKIDGALHNGGNDSIVSNDFTQVISNGIGAWITNNGRAELVSVFTYYAHIGYLAENGGRIRATNGNNSYGSFGSVAEGVDPFETPITGIVDNKSQYNATVVSVESDADKLFSFEYSHMGSDYTVVNYDIFGPGDGEVIEGDEFRDDGVFNVRILDLDDSSGELGGSGYVNVQNTAQSGTTTSLTLAATDGNISSAYPGMKVFVTGGNGVGQHAIVKAYNSGSKQADIVRETETVLTAGSFVTSDLYRIDELGTTDFTLISSLTNPQPGQIFSATGAGAGDGKATKVVDGWDHHVKGTTIVAPNSSSTYVIEPQAFFDAPTAPNATTADRAQSRTFEDTVYAETAKLYSAVGVTTYSGTFGADATFNITRNGSKYFVDIAGGGRNYARLETITLAGTSMDGATPANDITVTVTSVNSATGAITGIDFAGFGRAGQFVSVTAGAEVQLSVDGTTWTEVTLPGAAPTGQVRIATGLIFDGSSLLRDSATVIVAQTSTNANNIWYATDDLTSWTNTTLTGATINQPIDIAFGSGKFMVVHAGSDSHFFSEDGGVNWTEKASTLPATGYELVTYGQGKFVAVDKVTANVAYIDQLQATLSGTWQIQTLPNADNWADIAYGNNRFVIVSNNNNRGALSVDGGDTWSEITLPSGAYSSIAYGQGVFGATRTDSTNVAYSEFGNEWQEISVGDNSGPIAFGNPQRTGVFSVNGTGAGTTHNLLTIGSRARGRAGVASEKVFEIRLTDPGSNYLGAEAPKAYIYDPNNIYDVVVETRVGKGVVGQPSFANRGSGFISASAEVNAASSNGVADFFQTGTFVAVRRLTERPIAGSNVVFGSLPDKTFKLVNIVSFVGDEPGTYTAFLNLSPQMSVVDAPVDGDSVTLRIRYSQVRLTGHDFLDIGTGGFQTTNYPGLPTIDPDQTTETRVGGGGRVFFTTTDQDGNFRAGDLFSIEQSTGIATLNADAFNIAGLQELSLGEVTLGGASASISEFSTDPFFTANSDTVVPTQRAIKAYIEAQIGGGGASLNVNSVTAGEIFIAGNTITTITDPVINIQAKMNFQGGVVGLPIAYNYFLR